jgi:hypothetical protein
MRRLKYRYSRREPAKAAPATEIQPLVQQSATTLGSQLPSISSDLSHVQLLWAGRDGNDSHSKRSKGENRAHSRGTSAARRPTSSAS